MTWSVRDDGGPRVMIDLIFNTAEFSDMYKVYIYSAGFHNELSHTVSKVLCVYCLLLYNLLFFI